MRRLLVLSTALLWGLQFSLLNPALALLLVALFGASPAQVGAILAVYNASGFVASLALPAYADRRQNYLRPMLACAALTLGLVAVLAATSSLRLAVVGLVVLGGPAGVGVSLLFAQLKHAGAGRSDVVNTRAVISFAWVAGPPLASAVIAASGNRAVLLLIAAVAVLNVLTTAALLGAARRRGSPDAERAPISDAAAPMPRAAVVLVVVAFVALQATNSAAVSVMNLFVTRSLGLDVGWAGAALGLSAALEIPALLLIGRLGHRVSDVRLITVGSVLGIGYYAGMTYAAGPVALLALQVLNAAFFAVVAGVGISLFQRVIPRPGLASGLYTNTRRIGAIVSGPVIALGSVGALGGYRSIFGACALLTALAVILLLTLPTSRQHAHTCTPGAEVTTA